MPKKLYAVTNVKTSLPGGEPAWFPAGEEVDPSKFTKEQLIELHDNGAIEMRVVEAEVVTEPEESTETTETETSEEPVETEEESAPEGES